MAVLCVRIRLHRDNLARFEAHRGGGTSGGGLGRRIPLATPNDERSAEDEQRGGVLDNHLERSEGSSRDQVEGFNSVGPVFGAGVDGAGVRDAAYGDRPLQEGALAPGALDKRYRHGRQGDGQRQAGNASAAPEIGQSAGGSYRVKLERNQRVGKVIVEHLPRVSDSGGRQGILHEQAVQLLQPFLRVFGEAVAFGQRSDGSF